MAIGRRNLFAHLPFNNVTNYDIENEHSTVKKKIRELMLENNFSYAIKENKFLNKMHGPNTSISNYSDIDEFIAYGLSHP